MPDLPDLLRLPFPPIFLDEAARVELTASCRDADPIPRVADAGRVVTDPATGTRVQIMHNGLRMLADGYYGAWMTDLIGRLGGVHEPQEEIVFHHLLQHLPATANMVEIGAFWSYYLLWFVSGNPAGRRGLGIDPDPAHLEVGRRNAALNRLNIELVQGRIGAADAPPAPFATEASGVLEVPTLSPRSLLARAGMDRVDLLLCDAQGGEIDLMAGLAPLVAEGRVGVVLISTHSHHITGDPLTHQRVLHAVGALGGQVLVEHDVQESYSGDGLVAANFGPPLAGWQAPAISRCRRGASLFRDPLYDLAEALEASRS